MSDELEDRTTVTIISPAQRAGDDCTPPCILDWAQGKDMVDAPRPADIIPDKDRQLYTFQTGYTPDGKFFYEHFNPKNPLSYVICVFD